MAVFTRIALATIPTLLPKGGVMYMAVAAKKHATAFTRSRTAKGAGRMEVKNAFRKAAEGTRGMRVRGDRNEKISAGVKGLKTGVYHKRSRSRYAPLAGKMYVLGSPRERITESTRTE